MSDRSSGSRFKPLPIEGEEDDSESDSSVHEMKMSRDLYPLEIPATTVIQGSQSSGSSAGEMKLSRDFYQAGIPTAQTSRSMDFYPAEVTGTTVAQGSQSSDSSAEEMKLSRDYYPTTVASAQPTQAEDIGGYLPVRPGASTSGLQTSQQRYIKQRSVSSKPISTEEPSDLPFIWDHFRRESDAFDAVGVDALENMFGQSSKSSSQEEDASVNIEEDVRILKETGFNIDYPDGMLGEGFYGVVYRGHYGSGAPNMASNRFAVKVIEFDVSNDSDTLERRERFETEKFILTTVSHRNVVSIRMIINMGDIRSYPFKDMPNKRFLSPERVYLIMDFADGGELDYWMNKNYNKIEPSHRINLMRDLFFGMLYLHTNSIVHGDVHTGNVLMFYEMDEVVAKWADFGLGFVGSNKQYRYRMVKPIDMNQQFRLDIAGMYSVFWALLKGRHQCRPETEEEKKLMEEVMQMLRMMRNVQVTSLTDVHQQFKHILEDELILDEQHFQ